MSDHRIAQRATKRATGSSASYRRGVMAGSVASQLAVGDGMRPGGVGAQPLDLVLLVGLEVALVPVPLGRVGVVALPGQDVGGDPVQEPPVVADHHGAAG